MASLTLVAYNSRRLIKYGGISLISFLFLWWGLTASIKAYRAAHPPYVAPTVRFGIIDAIVFPKKDFNKKTFTAELADDRFPKYKDQASVYVIYRSKSALGVLEESKKTAALMGFSGDPKEINTGTYSFSDQNNRTLTMNVLESSFSMNYPYLSDQLLTTPEQMPNKDGAINAADNFLQQAGKLSQDLDEGEKKVSYWKISDNTLKAVDSLSEANIIRVDFFRKKMEGDLPVVSIEPGKASVSVLVSGSSVNIKKVVEVNFSHVDVDNSAASSSTYPIKSSQEAFEDLQKGNYWPAKDTAANSVVIRKIYLAYFEPVNLTQFMQPVYVFEGDGGFVAYVPGITDKYAK